MYNQKDLESNGIIYETFWTTVLSIVLTFPAECVFAGIFLMVYLAIYYASEYEPLNTGTPDLFAKGFLILFPSITPAEYLMFQ